jgi:hypothetical protein
MTCKHLSYLLCLAVSDSQDRIFLQHSPRITSNAPPASITSSYGPPTDSSEFPTSIASACHLRLRIPMVCTGCVLAIGDDQSHTTPFLYAEFRKIRKILNDSSGPDIQLCPSGFGQGIHQ